jgi:hypothetical protein
MAAPAPAPSPLRYPLGADTCFGQPLEVRSGSLRCVLRQRADGRSHRSGRAL